MKNHAFRFRPLLLSAVLLLSMIHKPVHAQTQEWLAACNGTTNQRDAARAMAVDNSGNVYVAGITDGANTRGIEEGVMLLAKYDASGILQWTQTFTGSGFTIGYANAIAIDGNGDIIIAGACSNFDDVNSTYWEIGDYYTVKYSASGQLLWAQSYDGLANHHDYASSVAIDANNNIYVTGSSVGNSSNQVFDMATVKYDANGVQQWVHRYNGPANSHDWGAKVVFKNGNLFVAGTSKGSGMAGGDIFTIKYNDVTGAIIWSARYDDGNSYWDNAQDMVADASGNVYVAGYVNSKGKKTVQSETNPNWVILKYNASGAQQWVKTYDGNGDDNYFYNSTVFNGDYPYAIALDNTGNIVVTGRSYTKVGSGNNTTTSLDMTTIKYNTSGTQQWVKSYDAPSKGEDCANAIATDGAGNIYITGRSFATGQGMNAATVKYNASGTQQWVTSYNSGSNVLDEGKAIMVGSSGKVHVAGAAGQDVLLIKYGQPAGSFRLANPESVTAQQVSVYPNPAMDRIFVDATQPLGMIRIIDQTGRVVIEKYAEALKTEVEMGGLTAGIYYLVGDRIQGATRILKIN